MTRRCITCWPLYTSCLALASLTFHRQVNPTGHWRASLHRVLLVFRTRPDIPFIFFCISSVTILVVPLDTRIILRQTVLKGVAVVAIVAVLTAPWLVRNYSNFGNPVFPLLHGQLGGAEWSSDQAAQLHNASMGPSLLKLTPTQMV